MSKVAFVVDITENQKLLLSETRAACKWFEMLFYFLSVLVLVYNILDTFKF